MQVSAKKKNNDDGITIAEDYPLPELPQNITPAATTVAQSSRPTATPVATATNGATTGSKIEVPAAVQTAAQTAAPSVAATAAPQPAMQPTTAPAPQQSNPQPAQPAKPTAPRRSALAGLSLAELLNSTTTHVEQAEEKKKSAADVVIDPQSEWKLNENRQKIVDDILQERPRFVVAFESMRIEGHTIKLEVPSQTLYEEIMRSKTEILMQMARAAGVDGMLEMDITINEEIKATRPIKLEDRIKFMTEKNPLLLELKKALDMEYE